MRGATHRFNEMQAPQAYFSATRTQRTSLKTAMVHDLFDCHRGSLTARMREGIAVGLDTNGPIEITSFIPFKISAQQAKRSRRLLAPTRPH